MKITQFEDLEIWKLSLVITRDVYDLTKKETFSRDFELSKQIHRAVISISSNIVEGFEKGNNNELIRYLRITKGSIGEVRNQLYIAFQIGYISDKEHSVVNEKLQQLARQVGSFITYLETKRSQHQFTKPKPNSKTR